MALTLDATVGGENSTSYVDVEWADAYHANLFSSAKWEDLSTEDRQRGLNQATNLIDRLKFHGVPKSKTQALAFPRVLIPASDGLTIPRQVMAAVAELALELATQFAEQAAGASNANAKLRADGVQRYKLGEYEIQFAQGGAGSLFAAFPPPVQALLRQWVKRGSNIVAGRRCESIWPSNLPWALQ